VDAVIRTSTEQSKVFDSLVSKNHFTLYFFHTIIAVIITSILQIAAGNSNQIKKTALIILRSYYHKAPRWYFSGVLAFTGLNYFEPGWSCVWHRLLRRTLKQTDHQSAVICSLLCRLALLLQIVAGCVFLYR